jgi:hypothetical protein
MPVVPMPKRKVDPKAEPPKVDPTFLDLAAAKMHTEGKINLDQTPFIDADRRGIEGAPRG